MGVFPLLTDLCIFLLEEIIAMCTLRLRALLANPRVWVVLRPSNTHIRDLGGEQSSSLMAPSHHHLPEGLSDGSTVSPHLTLSIGSVL